MSKKLIKIKCKGSGLKPLSKLKILQGELKELSKESYQKLRRRIEVYGFDAPFFVYKDYILDGTQRKRVLEEMLKDGWSLEKGEVPIVEIKADNLNDAKQRLLGYVSQFGKLTEDGMYEFIADLPDFDLETLDLPDFDLDGFIEGYLQDSQEVLTDDDAIPEDVEPVTKTGDLWLLGEHRLLCADCTIKANVSRLMGQEKADMVFTDPPYGVDYNGGVMTPREKLKGDSTTELYNPCCRMAMDFTVNDAPLYLWHAGVKGIAAADAAIAAGWQIRCEIIWNKNQAQYGALSAHYKQKHEPCYYCFKKGKSARWAGSKVEITVWDIDRAAKNEYHPTQKPVALAEKAIKNHICKIVLDLFLGSGSTLIACEKTGRKCYGMEIDPHYCDVIIKRWEDYTGKKAKLRKSKNASTSGNKQRT